MGRVWWAGASVWHSRAAKLNVAEYRAIETLRDGHPIQIRGLRPSDRAALLTAVGQSSPQSLFRRFFSLKRDFTEEEISRYVNVDFVTHVALVAALDEGGWETIIAGGRYVLADVERAELAFVVIDQFQRQGVGAALLAISLRSRVRLASGS
jgi:GNAT superfamily N-acetyltransferase